MLLYKNVKTQTPFYFYFIKEYILHTYIKFKIGKYELFQNDIHYKKL